MAEANISQEFCGPNGEELPLRIEDPLRGLIQHIAQELVEDPSAVKVRRIADSVDMVAYMLDVADRDQGRIIGRDGHTIKAFRSILTCIATRRGIRITMDMIDKRPRSHA